MEFTTLCYIKHDNKYLMLHRTKKEHDFNKDKWIGIGGHFEPDESPDECLLREVREETGLLLTSYRMRGFLTFCYGGICEYTCLYTADGFEGELHECNEGELEWVPENKLLSLNLFEGDLIFFKLLLDDAPFFSLKLEYDGNLLTSAVLNAKPLELLDIVDETGNPIGIARERSLCHLLGTLHRTAHVWIARQTADGYEILLQKRSHDKDSYPDCWDISSAGHIPAGCEPLESALRELQEELGIKAGADDLVKIGLHTGISHSSFYGKAFNNHEISTVYLFTRPIDTDRLTLQAQEVQSVCWMPLSKILQAAKDEAPGYCLFADEVEMLADKGCREANA